MTFKLNAAARIAQVRSVTAAISDGERKKFNVPKGYASLEDYLATLKLNLKTMRKKPEKYGDQISKDEKLVADLEKHLGK